MLLCAVPSLKFLSPAGHTMLVLLRCAHCVQALGLCRKKNITLPTIYYAHLVFGESLVCVMGWYLC